MYVLVMLLTALAALLPTCGAWAVVHVDQNAPGPDRDGKSWDTAFVKIQDGVCAATPGGEVWVADGAYVETITLGLGVQLYGGFLGAEPGGYEGDASQRDPDAHAAIIDANWAGSAMTIAGDMSGRALVDGFTLQRNEPSGSVIHCDGSIVTVSRVTTTSNPGAVGIHSTGGSITVEDCHLSGNGCGIAVYHGDAWLTGNVISANGQGIEGRWVGITLLRNVISDNNGSENAAEFAWSTVTARENVITRNSGGDKGGGIMLFECQVCLEDCIISENHCEGSGGGVYGYGSSGVISGCTVSGNSGVAAGGGIMWLGDRLELTGNSVTNNTVVGDVNEDDTAWGGGLCGITTLVSSANTIEGNTAKASSAWGGGAVVMDTASFHADTVRGNTADGVLDSRGGGVLAVGTVMLRDMIVAGNRARQGGGVSCYNASVAGAHVTITGDTAANGPGIGCDSDGWPSTVSIANSILWDGGDEVWVNDGSSVAITYSDVCGGYAGEGNTDVEPGFVDVANGDYHLVTTSPCIDKGDGFAAGMPYLDMDGDPRVCDGDGDCVALPDMGADEVRFAHESNKAPEDWFVPGWVWFSVPLHPRWSADASSILGFDCTNRVYMWEDAKKEFRLYPDDFTDLAVGTGYVALLKVGEAYTPVYEGAQPDLPMRRLLPAAGWCFVGVPSTQHILGTDLVVEKDGEARQAISDRDAADPWLNWNWIYWNPVAREARIMNPFGGGDDTWLHPWYGYRVWSNTEDVTIIFP